MHGSNQLQVDDACRHAERLIACGDVHSNTDKMIFHNKLQVTDFSHSFSKKKKPIENITSAFKFKMDVLSSKHVTCYIFLRILLMAIHFRFFIQNTPFIAKER